jgi:hypothetical protein
MANATVTKFDSASPSLQRAIQAIRRRRPLFAQVGGAVRQRLREHFRQRQAGPSKRAAKGWEPRYFWSGARGQSVEEKTQVTEITEDHVTVGIASPEFAFKLRGGEIRPKRGTMLALPLRNEAYLAGSPREGGLPGLFVYKARHSDAVFLAQREGASLRLQYQLVRKVTQQADPDALPPQSEILKTIDEAVDSYMLRAFQRKGGIA